MERAYRVRAIVPHATTARARGAVMLGDEMIGEASREMAEVVVAPGKRRRLWRKR